ncbi:unnamed protein product [Citrullus colocynthis]|uniref:Uncharacterized protein n=1 Tax=Citrullus colocynthis TaxID=252529 RepID=A0ABP0ZDD7_9ROSI
MRSFAGRLENFGPLEDAAFLFCNIADEADVKVTYKRFSLVTSSRHTPFRFVAELHILPHFFAHNSIGSWWRHELVLLHPVEEELGPIDFENFFTIHSNDFRRIIREVSQFPNTSVCVTITNSQVKFSVAFREIILSKQGRLN